MYPALTRGRESLPGQPYLCTTVTDGRVPVFRNFWAGVEAAKQLRAPERERRATLLAWVVMPDHVHILIIPESADLSVCMRLFKGRTARVIRGNACLWQPGFHDHAMRREEDLVAAARYVVANPLRAGRVR